MTFTDAGWGALLFASALGVLAIVFSIRTHHDCDHRYCPHKEVKK